MGEKRRAPRVPLRIEVLVGAKASHVEYRAIDLNTFGVRLRGATPLEVEATHVLRISTGVAPDEESTIVDGRVAWCEPAPGGTGSDFEMGIEFLDVDRHSQRFLNRTLARPIAERLAAARARRRR